MAVADRASRGTVSVGIARRHRGAPLFPARCGIFFRVRLDRTYTGMVRGLNIPNDIEIRVDGKRVGNFTLGGQPELRVSGSEYDDASNPLYTADSGLEVRVPVKAGLRQVTVTAVKSDAAKPEGLGPERIPIWGHDSTETFARRSSFATPYRRTYNGQVPQDSPSRKRILCARHVARTKRRARRRFDDAGAAWYRRPTTNEIFRRSSGSIRR